jgi:hypothetical protein
MALVMATGSAPTSLRTLSRNANLLDVRSVDMRRITLVITQPLQAALAELEWQFCRLNCWLRGDE